MQAIVTDNGLNFVKAVKTYFKTVNQATAEAANKEDNSLEGTDKSDACDVTMYDILQSGSRNTPSQTWFSSHIRCAAHTLNLLASTDIDKILNSEGDENFISFNDAYDKVKELWNLCNRSNKAADMCIRTISIFKNYYI